MEKISWNKLVFNLFLPFLDDDIPPFLGYTFIVQVEANKINIIALVYNISQFYLRQPLSNIDILKVRFFKTPYRIVVPPIFSYLIHVLSM